jgi:putative transposase
MAWTRALTLLCLSAEAKLSPVQLATLGWVHWHNNDRLHGYLKDVPPSEFEAAYAAQQADR